MTTLSDLIQKTLRRADPLGSTETLVLNGNTVAGASSIVISDPSGVLPNVQVGKRLAIDLEVFLVQAISGSTISVVPGYDGSTEAAHNSGALVYIAPRFNQFDVMTAINDDLLDLSSVENGLFQAQSLEITYNPSIVGYDLAGVTAIDSIISIRYQVPYPIGKWIPMRHGAWELTPSSDLTSFPSGYALSIYRGAYPGLPMRVTYRSPFGQFVALTDTTDSIGLPPTATDLPPLGAMVALVSPREVKRNQFDSEPDSRRAPEVPPGAVMNSVAGVLRMRQSRINAESARLEQRYSEQRL